MVKIRNSKVEAGRNYFLIFLLSIFIHISFTQNNRTYQTECLTTNIDGYVTIKIWDSSKGPKYNLEQARKDAVDAILFSGISGGNGCSTQPPFLVSVKEVDNFKAIEKSFFSKKGIWATFTRSALLETTLVTNLKVNSSKVYQVSISKNELRKYLEEQKIIKKLTNGF
jgi:hypothetical protein